MLLEHWQMNDPISGLPPVQYVFWIFFGAITTFSCYCTTYVVAFVTVWSDFELLYKNFQFSAIRPFSLHFLFPAPIFFAREVIKNN